MFSRKISKKFGAASARPVSAEKSTQCPESGELDEEQVWQAAFAFERNRHNLSELLASHRRPLLTTVSKATQTSAPHGQHSAPARHVGSLASNGESFKPLVQQLMGTVSELQHTMDVDQENEFRLRVALEKQTERANSLTLSLEMERERNQRLLKLISKVESPTSTEDERDYLMKPLGDASAADSALVQHSSSVASDRSSWHSASMESISPMLVQQRYDELAVTYGKCCRQLASKERKLRKCRCEIEALMVQYDELLEEFCKSQRRVEEVCKCFMRWKTLKAEELYNLKYAICFGWDCAMIALGFLTVELGSADLEAHRERVAQFRTNFRNFMDALKSCEWLQVGCDRPNCCWPGESRRRIKQPMDEERTQQLDFQLRLMRRGEECPRPIKDKRWDEQLAKFERICQKAGKRRKRRRKQYHLSGSSRSL